ncbi:MAG: glycosyltransferase [Deltaproteobacteria bacterium]|nr:glycosyltransferase [Deltaproteobacteria bacterium]
MISIGVDCRKIDHYGIGNVVKVIVDCLSGSSFLPVLFGNPSVILRFFPKARVVPFFRHHNDPFAFISLNKILQKTFEIDCFIAPHYVGVWSLGQKSHHIPIVMFLYDFIQVKHNRSFLKKIIHRSIIYNSVKSADLIVVPCENTKREGEKFGFNTLGWEVIALPVKKIFLSCPEFSKEEFYLCVTSSDKAHKGINNLLKIWKTSYPQLLVVGNLSSGRFAGKSNVRLLGNVTDEELVKLYAQAKWLVIPSIDEGYGYCFLESRYTYTPVISRPLPSFHAFKTSSDIFSHDFSDDAFKIAIEKSFVSDSRVNKEEFKLVQERFDIRHFKSKLISLLNWVLHACHSSRLDLSS